MAKWMKFTADVDYRHKSRAVTAYKAGSTVYLPDHIANDPQLEGRAEVAEKPSGVASDHGEGDGRRVYLMDRFENSLERLND